MADIKFGASNGFIVKNFLSEYQKTDGEIAPNLIHQVRTIDPVMTADKAYDQSRVYEAVNDAFKDLVKLIFTQEIQLHSESGINILVPSIKSVY